VNILVLGSDTFRVACVSATGPILQASFFDDDELALVFQTGAERILATILVSGIEEGLTAPIQRGTMSPSQVVRIQLLRTLTSQLQSLAPTPVTLARSHSLGTSRVDPATEPWLLALNGRPGRRTGSVLMRGGTEVEVLDMAEDEEEEEEEEGEEGEEGEVEGDIEMLDSEA